MFGRRVGSTLLRLPVYARLPLRPSPFQCPHDVPARALLISSTSQRFYATPGRPRKTVGEPSKPVKRAVKRAAKSKDGTDAATKQVRAKKSAATKKKPAPKKRAKKELTEERKAAQQAKTAKAKISELKKAALSPPPNKTHSAYNEFFKEKMKGFDGKAVHGPDRRQKMSDLVRPIAEEYKNLSPAELEHYNHLAHSSTDASRAAYKAWVESHTPEQIHLANRARLHLRRKLPDTKNTQKYSQIKDERAVKRPASAYIQFSVNRQATGDFKNIPIRERGKLIAEEWKALTESEKKKYKDLQFEDTTRYSNEHNTVYGYMPPNINGGQQQAAAAAA